MPKQVADEAVKELTAVRGVGPHTAQKLVAEGITSVKDLAFCRPQDVARIFGSLRKARLAINHARELVLSTEIRALAAAEYMKLIKEEEYVIHTGSHALDRLLGGGVRSHIIHCVAGAFASGKSELVMTTAVNCALGILRRPGESKYPDEPRISEGRAAVIIETEPHMVRPTRIREIAESRSDAKLAAKALEKIFILPARMASNPRSLSLCYDYIERELIGKRKLDVGLIAVDSFTLPFKVDFPGREMYPERAAEFALHFARLQHLADTYKLCVLLTGQVGGVPDEGLRLQTIAKVGVDKRPYGGDTLLHMAGVLLMLERLSGETQRSRAIVADAPDLPRQSCEIVITKRGIDDP